MIPIARPQVGAPEIENVARVLRSGMLAGALRWGEIEAFGIGAAEDIKEMGTDCVIMAVVHDAFKVVKR